MGVQWCQVVCIVNEPTANRFFNRFLQAFCQASAFEVALLRLRASEAHYQFNLLLVPQLGHSSNKSERPLPQKTEDPPASK